MISQCSQNIYRIHIYKCHATTNLYFRSSPFFFLLVLHKNKVVYPEQLLLPGVCPDRTHHTTTFSLIISEECEKEEKKIAHCKRERRYKIFTILKCEQGQKCSNSGISTTAHKKYICGDSANEWAVLPYTSII